MRCSIKSLNKRMDSKFSGRITLRDREKNYSVSLSQIILICVYTLKKIAKIIFHRGVLAWRCWFFVSFTRLAQYFYSTASSISYACEYDTNIIRCDAATVSDQKSNVRSYNIAWYGFWSQNVLFDNRLTDRQRESVCVCENGSVDVSKREKGMQRFHGLAAVISSYFVVGPWSSSPCSSSPLPSPVSHLPIGNKI